MKNDKHTERYTELIESYQRGFYSPRAFHFEILSAAGAKLEEARKVHFVTKEAYGQTRYYPEADAEWVAKMIGVKTVQERHFKILDGIGYEVIVDGANVFTGELEG